METVETENEADEREKYYITLYKSTDPAFGYNLQSGGHGAKSAEETKEIISQKASNRYSNGVKNPMSGKKHSDKTKELMSQKKLGSSNPMFGTKWTDAQRERCGTKGKKLNLTDKQREVLSQRCAAMGASVGLLAVQCQETGEMFRSITEAAKSYNVAISTMCGHLRGRQKTCKGKHFVYVN